MSYLRSDGKKKRREPVQDTFKAPAKKENIYDDIGEYKPDKRRKLVFSTNKIL